MGRILVAGGAGFIGSNLCQRLLDDNHDIICIDNLITSDRKNIEKFSSNSKFTFIEFDITNDLSKISDKLSNINYIYHLASPASPNKKSKRSYINFPIETLLVNSRGTYNLLQIASKHNTRFVYASTSEIYGDPEMDVLSEDYFGNVNPNGVRSVYDEAKRFGEAMVMAYYRKFNLDIRIARIFNTYGQSMQKDDGRVVSNFINQAILNEPITIYGNGKQTRSFCYVSDMVEAFVKLMFTEKISGEVINLGNPDERTILNIAELIKKMTNSNSEITFEDLPSDDPKKRKPDITKAKKLLSWEPKISLEEGLGRTIEYFKKI